MDFHIWEGGRVSSLSSNYIAPLCLHRTVFQRLCGRLSLSLTLMSHLPFKDRRKSERVISETS